MAERAQPLTAAVERQRRLLEEWRRSLAPAGTSDERAADCALTPRETTVLLLLAEALTADAIGRRLGISPCTVHEHVENIYRELGTRDRIGTLLHAQRLGPVAGVRGPPAVLGVLEVTAASGVPGGALVAVGGNAAEILERSGEVRQEQARPGVGGARSPASRRNCCHLAISGPPLRGCPPPEPAGRGPARCPSPSLPEPFVRGRAGVSPRPAGCSGWRGTGSPGRRRA